MRVNRLAWIQTFAQTQSLLQLDVSKKFTIARKYPNSNFLHFFRRFFTEQDDKHKNKLLLMMNPLFCVFFFFFVTYDEEKSISFRFNWLFVVRTWYVLKVGISHSLCHQGSQTQIRMKTAFQREIALRALLLGKEGSAGLTLRNTRPCVCVPKFEFKS